MNRRSYLAALSTFGLAGCNERFEVRTPTATTSAATRTETATRTATRTETATPPVDADTPTEAPTETGTPTEAETDTPTVTPRPFRRELAPVRRPLLSMYEAYLAQGTDATSLLDVDARVTDFRYLELNGPHGQAGDAIVDAREREEGPEYRAILDRLVTVRRFLWVCAQAQEQFPRAYLVLEDLHGVLEDEAVDRARDRLSTLTGDRLRRARAGYRNTRDVGESTAAESVDFMDAEEWDGKLEQYATEADTIERVEAPLTSFIDGIADLVDARRYRREDEDNQAERRANAAIEHLGTAVDGLDGLVEAGVAASMEGLIGDLSALAVGKREDARVVLNDG